MLSWLPCPSRNTFHGLASQLQSQGENEWQPQFALPPENPHAASVSATNAASVSLNLMSLAYYEIGSRVTRRCPDRTTRDSCTILTCGKLFTTDDSKCFEMAKGGVSALAKTHQELQRGRGSPQPGRVRWATAPCGVVLIPEKFY